MFTGVVQECATVVGVERRRGIERLNLHAPQTAQHLEVGESVAVNGVCLTVVRIDRGTLSFDVIPETRRLTNLWDVTRGSRVNVERSLTLSDRLNGHMVLGHIDGVGRVIRLRRVGGEVILEIRVDRSLARYLVPKGPVAIDGISLTVAGTPTASRVTVCLIPETLRRTTLGIRQVGELVNIEVDYLAKLLVHLSGSKDFVRPRRRLMRNGGTSRRRRVRV